MKPKTAFWGAVIIAMLLWAVPSSDDILGLFSFQEFEVIVTEEYKNNLQYETISIKKLSFKDAQNVLVSISSFESKKIESNTCIDGITTSSDKDREISITFEKMPANYECSLTVSSSPDTSIHDIDIMAEGLQKYEWSSVDQKFKPMWQIMGIVIVIVTCWAIYSIVIVEFLKSKISLFHYGSISLNDLNEEYGKGFVGLDELILGAIKKNKKTVKKIAIFLNIPKSDVKKRLKFMEKKGVLSID